MSMTTLIIGGALVLAIVCVSLYGAATLPPGAQVPVHFGSTGYNRWVSKNVGLAIWPVAAVVVFVIIAVTVHDHQTHGNLGPTVGLSIALGVMLVADIGALTVALSRSRRG
jgi:hypothetical protein